MGRFGLRSSAAFSTLSERVALKLQDPSLVGDGVLSGETFDVNDPGASAQQFEDGSAVIARVRRMGRDDAKTVSLMSFRGLRCLVFVSERRRLLRANHRIVAN